MANVAPYVAQIRQAVYGEQVRESIATSIEMMNQDNIDTLQEYNDTIGDVEAATTAANTAASGATAITEEVQQKLDDGDFIGEQGPAGDAATVQVGTVQTGQPGSAAQVTNSGTNTAAILNFIIPQGLTGQIENLDTAQVTFGIDTVYQNIASGMTVADMFGRLQLLMNMIMLTDTQASALNTVLELASESRLPQILDKLATFKDASGIKANDGDGASSNVQDVLDEITGRSFSRYNGFDSISVASSTTTYTRLGTITIPAGKGIVQGAASFPSNATGMRRLVIGGATGTPSMARNSSVSQDASSNGATVMQVTLFFDLAEETTYGLYAMQNSGSALSVNGSFGYAQLK